MILYGFAALGWLLLLWLAYEYCRLCLRFGKLLDIAQTQYGMLEMANGLLAKAADNLSAKAAEPVVQRIHSVSYSSRMDH